MTWNTRWRPGWKPRAIWWSCPAARGHEYVRVGQNGIRAKLGIDATVPFAEKSRFARCEFEKVSVDPNMLSADPQVIRTRLGL